MLEKMKANLSKAATVGFKQVLYSLFHKKCLQHCLQEVWLEIACMHFCSITVLQILLPYNKGILHLPTPCIIKDCELVHTHGIFTFPGSELMLRLGEKRKTQLLESNERFFNCADLHQVQLLPISWPSPPAGHLLWLPPGHHQVCRTPQICHFPVFTYLLCNQNILHSSHTLIQAKQLDHLIFYSFQFVIFV